MSTNLIDRHQLRAHPVTCAGVFWATFAGTLMALLVFTALALFTGRYVFRAWANELRTINDVGPASRPK